MAPPERITVGVDGLQLPVAELLAGRGFVTGKSGSGKSNTASVVVEELLSLGLPLLIVDTDGEYYGLKEDFDLVHAGAEESCDMQVTEGDAETVAEMALEDNVPVILDVSGFLDVEDAKSIIHGVVRQLFAKEKRVQKPFLLLVEEVHEFIPESGGLDDLGEELLRVAKRGRKRGLGMVGISQRPAAVDKDFITQCDWIVWHRLTWDNDTTVVGQILGNEAAETVQDLADGEALLMTDWDERVRRVQFRRKRTYDAGATPGLEDIERRQTTASAAIGGEAGADGESDTGDADDGSVDADDDRSGSGSPAGEGVADGGDGGTLQPTSVEPAVGGGPTDDLRRRSARPVEHRQDGTRTRPVPTPPAERSDDPVEEFGQLTHYVFRRVQHAVVSVFLVVRDAVARAGGYVAGVGRRWAQTIGHTWRTLRREDRLSPGRADRAVEAVTVPRVALAVLLLVVLVLLVVAG